MGLDGVVPGVAFTLLTRSSPQDNAFSVFLVKLLQDSNQHASVSPELLTMAKGDPQWARVMSGQGGRGQGGRGQGSGGSGLGYTAQGGGHQKAMTSAMLAEMSAGGRIGGGGAHRTSSVDIGVVRAYEKLVGGHRSSVSDTAGSSTGGGQGVAVAVPGEMAANPYMEGRSMGRGKHMTQPSWAPPSASDNTTNSSSSCSSASSYSGNASGEAGQFRDVKEEEHVKKRRKNRFSELFTDPSPAAVTAADTLPLSSVTGYGVDTSILNHQPMHDQYMKQQSVPVPQSNPLPGFVRASGAGGLSSVIPSQAPQLQQQVANSSGRESGISCNRSGVSSGEGSRVRKSRWE
jgi:hypothetical protein